MYQLSNAQVSLKRQTCIIEFMLILCARKFGTGHFGEATCIGSILCIRKSGKHIIGCQFGPLFGQNLNFSLSIIDF